MKFITFVFCAACTATLMGGQTQEAPSDSAVAIIRDALKTAETEGVEAALARLSAESGDTERMLVRAFQQVAGQTLPARGELMFQLQVRTRLEGFEDLQWVLTHDAKKYSITALTSYLSPVAGSIVAKVKLANSAVIHLSLSGDRKSIYAQTMHGTLHILDAKTLAIVGTSQPKGRIVRTLTGPDGDLIFRLGEQNIVYIDSLASNERISRYIGDASLLNPQVSEDVPVAISPDGRDFVTPRGLMLHVTDSQGKDKERWGLGILVYPRISIDEDPATKKALSGSQPLGIEFIDESDLQIASADGSVVRVSYRNKKCLGHIKASGTMFHAMAFASDHSRIGFCGAGSAVEVLDADGKVVLKEKGNPAAPAEHEKLKQLGLDPAIFRHKFSATRIALANAGQTVAVGDEAGFVHIWRGEQFEYHGIPSHTGSAACLITAADDRMFVSGGTDGYVCLIDPDPNMASPVALPDTVVPEIVSTDPGHRWRAYYQDNTISVESIPDGKVFCQIPLSREDTKQLVPVQSVGVKKDRSAVLVGGNGFVLHWNPATQESRKVPIQLSETNDITGKSNVVTGPVMVSPDGSSCVFWPRVNAAVFDPETGKERLVFTDAGFAIDEHHPWVGDDELAVWGEWHYYLDIFDDAFLGPEFAEWRTSVLQNDNVNYGTAHGVVVNNVQTNRETMLVFGMRTYSSKVAACAPVVVMSGRQRPDAEHATALVCFLKHREMRSVRLPEKDCRVFGVTNDGTHFLTFTASEGGLLRVWNCDDGEIISQFHTNIGFIPTFDGRVIRFASAQGPVAFRLHGVE